MASDTTNPARGEAAGLGISSSFSGVDNPKHSLSPAKKQLPSAVDRVKRELLLDAIHEACGDVIEYADTAQLFVSHRDRRALFPAIDGLVAKAIAVGEAAADLRKLLGARSEGGA